MQNLEREFAKHRAQTKSEGDRRQEDVDALENRLAEARRAAEAARKRAEAAEKEVTAAREEAAAAGDRVKKMEAEAKKREQSGSSENSKVPVYPLQTSSPQ